MENIDPISSALGRLEAKQEILIKQNEVLFSKFDSLTEKGCPLGKANAAAIEEIRGGHKTTAVVWGSGAGALLASMAEVLRHVFGK